MSTVANQPRRERRAAPGPGSSRAPSQPSSLSAKLARFGVPVPPRIAAFLDGPELARYEGARGWGFSGWSGDTKLKVRWGSPRLVHIYEYASDFEEGVTSRYLPLAALGPESHMFVVDVTDDALPVYFFDYESGFTRWADSFDGFLGKLLAKGELTPSEQLDKAYEQGRALHDEQRHADVRALLEPIAARFADLGDPWDDARRTLGGVLNLLGIAREHTGDIPGALAAYERALAHGADAAGLNICDLWLDHFKDYGKLVEYAEARREQIYAFADKYAWFHIRNYLGQGYLLTGRPREAIRAYHQIADMFGVAEPAKLREAVTDLRALIGARPEVDRGAAEQILAWLDAPPPALPADRLAAMRAWWGALPDAVAQAIREAAHFEDAPSDEDLARVAELTELEVTHAELRDVSWVAMLPRLEDLDLEDNALTELAPLASLTRLRKLDVSENKLTTLRALAPLVRLERLSAGENKLANLDGLEGMRELSYLHVNEAGLRSIEALRGLPELAEVTVYDNKIADLSPLADSPRLKEISSFSNPIATGLAALAGLPWLESVDAGDDTPAAEIAALRAANPVVEIDHVDDDDAVAPAPDPELAEVRAWWSALSPAWRERLRSKLDRDERTRPEPSDAALLELVREDSLHLDDEPLPDLAPLARFTRLDYLNIGNAGVTDLAAIAGLPRLRDLLVRDNPLASLAPLAEARVLEELYIERCRLASLAGLDRCRQLREIYAEDNLIADLGPLAALDQLRILDLEGNPIRSLAPLARLPRLHTLRLGLAQVTDLAPLADCRRLRVLEIWANPGVRGALALADLPDLARVISHRSLPADELAELHRRRPDVAVD